MGCGLIWKLYNQNQPILARVASHCRRPLSQSVLPTFAQLLSLKARLARYQPEEVRVNLRFLFAITAPNPKKDRCSPASWPSLKFNTNAVVLWERTENSWTDCSAAKKSPVWSRRPVALGQIFDNFWPGLEKFEFFLVKSTCVKSVCLFLDSPWRSD